MGHVVRAHAHCKFYQKNILTPIRLDLERPNSVYGENTCGRGVFIGGQPRLISKNGAQAPHTFGTSRSYMRLQQTNVA